MPLLGLLESLMSMPQVHDARSQLSLILFLLICCRVEGNKELKSLAHAILSKFPISACVDITSVGVEPVCLAVSSAEQASPRPDCFAQDQCD